MTYYANDLEDKILDESGILPEKGVFIDVGAGPDGIKGSNTYFFEQKGWKGVCIDANPQNAKSLGKNRKTVHCPIIVSSKNGRQKLYFNPNDPDTAGLIPTERNSGKSVELDSATLEDLLIIEDIGEIDLLSIDTEGTELDVWRSMDWGKHKPKIVIVEAVTQKEINVEIIPELEKLGYSYSMTIGPNLVFQYTKIKRNPHLVVYGSSYDRGLEHLLKMWPEVRKAVPDAELHVFYGWFLFDRVYADNPERQAWKEKMNKLTEAEGITHLGRISHQACIVEHMKAGIWAYPTHFGEISCITAMRAQAYGSVPCVINYAALKETVKWGVKIEGDIYEPEVKKLYCDALIGLLKDEEYQETVRKEMMTGARDLFSWRKVAEQWTEEFKKVESLDEQAMKLIMTDEPIEAIKLLPPENPIRQKLAKKLRHLVYPDEYKKKYADDPMNWRPGVVNYPRHDWILKEAKDAKNLIDLGCYEGSLVSRFGKGAKGVEMCKAAEDKKRNIVQGDALTYQDGDKYDAVVACELIEHLPDPIVLIKNMLALVSDNGWCYLTTPNGCFDPEGTKKVWEDEEALFDHVRTYNKEKMAELLKGYEYEITENGKELYVKFRKSLVKEVDALMEDNQALKAWDLVKDTDSPLKERVWLRVKHAFNDKEYKDYYQNKLIENPMPEDIALDCTQFSARFRWVVDELKRTDYKTILDVGCADGYLCLTLAKLGYDCTGVNLYEPSVKLARERAEKNKLDCKFLCGDLFEVKGEYDAVVLLEVLEHLPDPQKAIDYCMSLTKGSLYISTPSPESKGIKLHKEEVGHASWDDGTPSGHLRIFTDKELLELCKNYQVEKILIDPEGNYLLEVKK